MSKSILKKGDKIPFTQISNDVLYSDKLSFKAKGLYAYMLAKPDNWNFSAKRISKEVKDGRDSILSALKELQKIGLIQYIKHSSGRSEYTIYSNIQLETPLEQPNPENPTKAIEPNPENPTVGKPHRGKTQPIINKDLEKQRDKKIVKGLKNPSLEQSTKEHILECENSQATAQYHIELIMQNLAKTSRV